MRKKFNSVVSALVEHDKDAILLLGDIGVYNFHKTLEDFPDRAFNIGILEQSMVGVAAGFSLQGYTPIVHTIAPFIVERAFEQIKIDFGYQGLPGNFVSVGASFDYAALGCTHHCPGDVNLLSNIPGVNVFVPGDEKEFEYLFRNNWKNGQLNYFRLSELQNSKTQNSSEGSFSQIKSGNLGTIIVVGPILDRVLEATEHIDAELLYLNSFPKDGLNLQDFDCVSNNLVIIEPYYSGLVLQNLSPMLAKNAHRILQIGVPRKFLTNYGNVEDHYTSIGFDPPQLFTRISNFLNE